MCVSAPPDQTPPFYPPACGVGMSTTTTLLLLHYYYRCDTGAATTLTTTMIWHGLVVRGGGGLWKFATPFALRGPVGTHRSVNWLPLHLRCMRPPRGMLSPSSTIWHGPVDAWQYSTSVVAAGMLPGPSQCAPPCALATPYFQR